MNISQDDMHATVHIAISSCEC